MASTPNQKVLPENRMAEAAKKILSPSSWGNTENIEDPEWIVIFGETRTGKSTQSLSIVEYDILKAIMDGKDQEEIPRAYIINMDSSGHRDMENFPFLLESGQVIQRYCKDVEEVMIASYALAGNKERGIKGIARRGDWIVVDRATVVWEQFPNYWCETRLKKTSDQIEFEYQTSAGEGALKKGSAILEYYARGINPLWFSWVETLKSTGAHIIFLCAARELQTESTKVRGKDSQDKITNFHQIGYVPSMQSDTWSRFHTQLYLERPFANKKFYVRTAGDRGQRKWLGSDGRCEIGFDAETGLGKIYLGEVAGWDNK